MRSLIVVLTLVLAAQAFAYSATEDTWNSPAGGYAPPTPGPVYCWQREVLYDNGPVWNQVYGTVYESVLQTTLGMNTYGFGHAIGYGYRMADDFVIPAGETWDIETITFFAYQTGAPTSPSTFTDYRVQIWQDDIPGQGMLVWGDLTTNRLATSVWSNVYRTYDTVPHATNRPIFANTCTVPVTLGPGHYWLDWMCAGSLTSGPWAPPISIWNATVTGDGWQYTTAWAHALDTGTNARQGLPFIIEGAIPSAVQETTWGSIKALYR